jgi:hypothetical protein
MKRRHFLTTTAAATALGTIAGCTQGPGDGGTDDPTDDPTEDPTDTSSPTDSPTASPGEDGSPVPDDSTGSSGSAWGESGAGDGYSYSVSFQNAECSGEQGAVEITRDEDASAIDVDGAIGVSNPCHTASVESIEYDESAAALTVSLSSSEDSEEGQLCAQCMATIEYEAEITFDDDLPEEVSVHHDKQGWSASWGSSSAAPPATEGGTNETSQ